MEAKEKRLPYSTLTGFLTTLLLALSKVSTYLFDVRVRLNSSLLAFPDERRGRKPPLQGKDGPVAASPSPSSSGTVREVVHGASASKSDAGLFQGGMVPERDLLQSDEVHEPELNLLQSGPPSPLILSPDSPDGATPHGW